MLSLHYYLYSYIANNFNVAVLYDMRILSHMRMGRPICIWHVPYVYGMVLLFHMHMGVLYMRMALK